MNLVDVLVQSAGFSFLAGVFLILSGVLVGTALVVATTGARRQLLTDRLSGLSGPVQAEAVSTVIDDLKPSANPDENALARFRYDLAVAVERAGGRTALIMMIVMGVLSGVIVGYASVRVFLVPVPTGLVIGIGVGLLMARKTLGDAQRKRMLQFLDQLPDAIDLIVRAAKAGIPVTEALVVAGNETQEPVKTEFKRIGGSIQLGVDIKDALIEAAERIRLADFDFLVVALIVQRETGGQLAETLMNLSTILRRRKETRQKVRALTAEGRLSAKVVAALPFVAAGAIAVINPGYMDSLFTESTGRNILLIALGCLGAGLFVIGNITKGEA